MDKNQTQRKKGEIGKLILEAIDEKPQRYTEIRKFIKEKRGHIADQVLSYNLQSLKRKGEIEHAAIGGVVMWKRAQLRTEKIIQAIRKEILEDETPVQYSHPNLSPSFVSPPMFERGEGANPTLDMDKITRGIFTEYVENILKCVPVAEEVPNDEKFAKDAIEETKKRAINILSFTAWCLWQGHRLIELELNPSITNEADRLYVDMYGTKRRDAKHVIELLKAAASEGEFYFEMHGAFEAYTFLEHRIHCGLCLALGDEMKLPRYVVRLLCGALGEILVRGACTIEDVWDGKFKQLIDEFYDDGKRTLMFNLSEFTEAVRALMGVFNKKFRPILTRTRRATQNEIEILNIDHISRAAIESVPSRVDDKWLKNRKEAFLEFLEKVKEIKFYYLSAVGYQELERWPMELEVVDEVDKTLKNLEKAGQNFNHRAPEIYAVLRYIDNAIYALERNRNLPKCRNRRERLGFQYLFPFAQTPQTLWEYDPRTRRVEWWESFREKVDRIKNNIDPRWLKLAKKAYAEDRAPTRQELDACLNFRGGKSPSFREE